MSELKREAFNAFRGILEGEIEDLERHRSGSQKDASHAMESRYDTFREDAQALGAGFQIKLEQKRGELALIKSIRDQCIRVTKSISAGALVALVNGDGNEVNYYVIPGGEGKELTIGGKKYKCISPTAPIGKNMLGKKEGDEVKSKKPFEVVSVE